MGLFVCCIFVPQVAYMLGIVVSKELIVAVGMKFVLGVFVMSQYAV